MFWLEIVRNIHLPQRTLWALRSRKLFLLHFVLFAVDDWSDRCLRRLCYYFVSLCESFTLSILVRWTKIKKLERCLHYFNIQNRKAKCFTDRRNWLLAHVRLKTKWRRYTHVGRPNNSNNNSTLTKSKLRNHNTHTDTRMWCLLVYVLVWVCIFIQLAVIICARYIPLPVQHLTPTSLHVSFCCLFLIIFSVVSNYLFVVVFLIEFVRSFVTAVAGWFFQFNCNAFSSTPWKISRNAAIAENNWKHLVIYSSVKCEFTWFGKVVKWNKRTELVRQQTNKRKKSGVGMIKRIK